jgi:hexokinase
MKNATKEFCLRHGLLLDMDATMAGVETFREEIRQGLEGKETSSLKALPSYIDPSRGVDSSENVIVMDVGGTNLRVALVSFAERMPQILHFENHPMPGITGVYSPDEFFWELASHLTPLADKAAKIGICFSFPADILPNRDARIINFTKEIRVPGAEGMLVWEGIRDALKRQGLDHDKKAAVLNDTTAALLGATACSGGRLFDGYIGLILGTGTNTCYTERNENIKKAPMLASTPGKTIINLESGGYSKAPRTDIDIRFDAKTDMPGAQMFEKMISGAYQGGLFHELLQTASLEGCFSREFSQALDGLPVITGKQMDEFCDFPYGGGALAALAGNNEKDREALYTLMDAFFDRVARLITINLAAILSQMDAGKKPYLPVCVSAEGTTFYKAKLFRPKLDYYMELCARRKMGLNYELVRTENCVLFGTAAAGLLA